MQKPILKAMMCNIIPEQKIVPPMPKNSYVTPEKFSFKELLEGKLESRIEVYKDEARRLRDDIPKNDALGIIDAYNKGMLYELEKVISDLESLLK